MCSVCMVDIFVQEFFLFLTVTVYLDTIGCVIGKMCVSERVEQKVIPFGKCYRFTL